MFFVAFHDAHFPAPRFGRLFNCAVCYVIRHLHNRGNIFATLFFTFILRQTGFQFDFQLPEKCQTEMPFCKKIKNALADRPLRRCALCGGAVGDTVGRLGRQPPSEELRDVGYPHIRTEYYFRNENMCYLSLQNVIILMNL